MAKKGKISPDNKKAMKTTVIVLIVFALAAAVYLYLHQDKQKSGKSSSKVFAPPKEFYEDSPVVKTSKRPVVTAPIVKPVKRQSVATVGKLPPASGARIAFVLDDWGYRMSNCHFLKEIKAPLAIAVLPGLRHSNDMMKCASVYDKDIMLHLPLEPYHTADSYPDYYLITTKMAPSKVESLLDDTFKKMPMIIGVNNHMGSKATEDKPLMKLIFKKIKKKGLFFIDSMTSPHPSVCGPLADEMKLPFAKRDTFLDNVNTKEAIEQQMVELTQKARRQGYAIAIGHDRALTLQVIQESIPILQKQGFVIVHVKELLRNTNN
jgi:polysaccharide deacetylase 2 family uncharacterized protein YibQ